MEGLPLKRKEAGNFGDSIDANIETQSVLATERLSEGKMQDNTKPVKRQVNKVSKKKALEKEDSNSNSRQPFNVPNYRFTPVIPDPRGVMLSPWDRAPQLRLADNNMSVSGFKGYRMIRATHGGSWYFEVTIREDFQQDKCEEKFCKIAGSARLGWARASAYMQGPVGYDRQGGVVHEQRPKPYTRPDPIRSTLHEKTQAQLEGPQIKAGDVVGIYIHLPSRCQNNPVPESAAAQNDAPEDKNCDSSGETQQARPGEPEAAGNPALKWSSGRQKLPWQDSKVEYYLDEDKDTANEPLPGSAIRFSVNGHDHGVAFADISAGTYYPAASLYMGGHVTFNFGPDFKHPPLGSSDTRPVSDLATASETQA